MTEIRADTAAAAGANRTRYHSRLEDANLAPLWSFFKDWFTAVPHVRSKPYLWRYDTLRPLILESAAVIDPAEAERRVLALENPGLAGRRLAMESLYAGFQLIMPGESAPCHRHTPAALRFVVEGGGAYTTVDGEKAYMQPGDLIVTPSWSWHQHGHEGSGPCVWLDVLDVALVHLFNATFTEHRAQAPGQSSDGTQIGSPAAPAGVRSGVDAGDLAPRLAFHYPYGSARAALERQRRRGVADACHGHRLAYKNVGTGGDAVPTITTRLQWLDGGVATCAYRTTAGSLYCVVEGTGRVHVGDGPQTETLEYRPRDVIVVPSWSPLRFEAGEDSVLFSASDEAAQRLLGLWREERGPTAERMPARG